MALYMYCFQDSIYISQSAFFTSAFLSQAVLSLLNPLHRGHKVCISSVLNMKLEHHVILNFSPTVSRLLISFCGTISYSFLMVTLHTLCVISGEYGQAKHTAIPAELLHNSRKRETAKEGSTAQPGESGFVV